MHHCRPSLLCQFSSLLKVAFRRASSSLAVALPAVRTPSELHELSSSSSSIASSAVSTPSELLRELRRFAQSGADYPPSLSGDAHACASGAKHVVAEAPYQRAGGMGKVVSDRVTFSCTGCGSCCRGFSDSVWLDPGDVARIARSPLAAQRSGSEALLGDKHLRRDTLGLWLASALPAGTALPQLLQPNGAIFGWQDGRCVHTEPIAFGGVDGGEEGESTDAGLWGGDDGERAGVGGVAPLTFLASVVDDAGSNEGNGDESQPLQSRRTRRLRRNNGSGVAPTSAQRICSFAVKGGSGKGSSVTCSLGPEHMPTACALYPFGELWTPPLPPTALDNEGPRAPHFGSLDAARCEGVRGVYLGHDAALPPPPESVSVAEYRSARGLDARRDSALAFRALATAAAALQLERRLASAGHNLAAALVDASLRGGAVSAPLSALTGGDKDHSLAAAEAERLLRQLAMRCAREQPNGAEGKEDRSAPSDLKGTAASLVHASWRRAWYEPPSSAGSVFADEARRHENIVEQTRRVARHWQAVIESMTCATDALVERLVRAEAHEKAGDVAARASVQRPMQRHRRRQSLRREHVLSLAAEATHVVREHILMRQAYM